VTDIEVLGEQPPELDHAEDEQEEHRSYQGEFDQARPMIPPRFGPQDAIPS
jgi:hypothetical protein